MEFPLVTAAQRAGEGDRLGPPWDRGEAVEVPLLASAPVESVIAARGSQRRMDASRGLSQDLLRTCMSVALRGLGLPHWVVVHDVAGLAPGVYRWPSLAAPVRAGALRDELYRVCLDQALGRDAAFVAIAATDLEKLSDPAYRDAHLAAGLAEGRLHLAAYALGASASGMAVLKSLTNAACEAASLGGRTKTRLLVVLARRRPASQLEETATPPDIVSLHSQL